VTKQAPEGPILHPTVSKIAGLHPTVLKIAGSVLVRSDRISASALGDRARQLVLVAALLLLLIAAALLLPVARCRSCDMPLGSCSFYAIWRCPVGRAEGDSFSNDGRGSECGVSAT
jgi:hypothetical protein